jgi:response regulator of citrate/malate metabolism
VDYLVKPFTLERLQQALARFRTRAQALSEVNLGQKDIDRLYTQHSVQRLPKGLRPGTLALIRAELRASSEALTAEEVAERTSVARVTARRYLEYLVTVHEAASVANAEGLGRPHKRYSWSLT